MAEHPHGQRGNKRSMGKIIIPSASEVREYLEKEDAVLKLLETYIPPFEQDYWFGFDIAGYYYCIALISLSDYRNEDCEKQLRETTRQLIERDTEFKRIPVLMRNMKVLGTERPMLKGLGEAIKKAMEARSGVVS